VLYLPINIEIEKSFERKSSLSNEEEEEDQYSEDEEMKDDFFSKYITADNTLKRDYSDNMSTFIISDKNSNPSMSGKHDFSRKFRSKTNLE
jgi:hypothetical protein